MIVLHHLIELSLTTELFESYGICFFTLVPGKEAVSKAVSPKSQE